MTFNQENRPGLRFKYHVQQSVVAQNSVHLSLTPILFGFALLIVSALLHASEPAPCGNGDAGGTTRVSLSELAANADLVAVAQVKDTDYVYARTFPNEGSAYMKTLIIYKNKQPVDDIIEVYEKGLHPYECYFENPTVFEEGRRYLVFFRLDPEDSQLYRGFAAGCALEIFVTQANGYALKYPVDGMCLSDELAELASPYDFHDHYALIEEETLSPAQRDKLLADGLIIPYQDRFKYTHGVDLSTVRKLIPAEALKE